LPVYSAAEDARQFEHAALAGGAKRRARRLPSPRASRMPGRIARSTPTRRASATCGRTMPALRHIGCRCASGRMRSPWPRKDRCRGVAAGGTGKIFGLGVTMRACHLLIVRGPIL